MHTIQQEPALAALLPRLHEPDIAFRRGRIAWCSGDFLEALRYDRVLLSILYGILERMYKRKWSIMNIESRPIDSVQPQGWPK